MASRSYSPNRPGGGTAWRPIRRSWRAAGLAALGLGVLACSDTGLLGYSGDAAPDLGMGPDVAVAFDPTVDPDHGKYPDASGSGATEADGAVVSCDTASTFYRDKDGDGHGVDDQTISACSPPAGYAPTADDCNDEDAAISPSAREACNGLDDDCDDRLDEGFTQETFFLDADGDGWGGDGFVLSCAPPPGYVQKAGDCVDFNPNIFPGADELCNDVDDDCDGLIDNDLSVELRYRDYDGDGFATETADTQSTCGDLPGWVLPKDADADGEPDWDCNDSNNTVYPGAAELCDTILNNCLQAKADQHCPRACGGAWPAKVGTTSGYATVANLDNDAELEVVAVGGGKCHVFEHDGSVKWEAPCTQHYSHVSLADVDRDGTLDVITTDGGSVRVRSGSTGDQIGHYPGMGAGAYYGVSAWDIDGDGYVDIVPAAGGTQASVAFTGATPIVARILTLVPPLSGESYHLPPPLITDLDGDGVAEIGLTSSGWSCARGSDYSACAGRMYVLRADGQRYNDPTYQDPDVPHFEVAPLSYGGEGAFGLVADFLGAGQLQIFQPFGGAASRHYFWDSKGNETEAPDRFKTLPLPAPIDESYRLDPKGRLRVFGGPVVDIEGDGSYEVIDGSQGHLAISHQGEVMDGYPLSVGLSYPPVIGDLDRDGRLDIVFLGSPSGSVHCYELGEGSYDDMRVLNYGMGNLSRRAYPTNAYDPYEPNDAPNRPFVASLATNPVKASRAFRPLGLQDVWSAGTGWRTRLRGAIATPGDKDFFVVYGGWGQFTLRSQLKDYELVVHIYDGETYLETRSARGQQATVSCHSTTSCSPTANGMYIIEVRGVDPETDYGPWPYMLDIVGAR